MPSENSFEAKFGQIADSVIYDRSPLLAKWKVGFQILDKDEDDTRAAGAMAYKLGRQWAYVPAFWLDGKLKGTNLLYLRQQDVFVPNKESWINYVMAKLPAIMGEGASKSDDTQAPGGRKSQGETAIDLGFAGHSDKYAFQTRKGDLDLLQPMDKIAMTTPPADGYVDTSLDVWIPRLGKQAALALAKSINSNPTLELALSRHYDMDALRDVLAKTAAAKPVKCKRGLTVVTSPMDKNASLLTPAQRAILAKEGMVILEDEPATGIPREDNVDTGIIGPPEGPGRYEVLMRGGRMEEMNLAGPLKYTTHSNTSWTPSYTAPMTATSNEGDTGSYYVVTSGEYSGKTVDSRLVLARRVNDFSLRGRKLQDPAGTLRGTTLGERSVLVTKDGECVMVSGAGNGVYNVFGLSAGTLSGAMGNSERVRIEATGRPGRLTLSNGVLYLPSEGVAVLSYDSSYESVPLGTYNELPMTMDKEGFARVKVYADGSGQWGISGPRGSLNGLDKKASARELIGGYGVAADLAIGMLDKEARKAASTGHPSATRYWMKEAQGYLDEEPVEVSNEILAPEQHVNPLEDAEIREIDERSRKGAQGILDVSVLTALAKRSDTEEMIDSYMTDMVKAMDRVGRLLFLFYWNNEDFVETYGNREMYELETSLTDVFEGLSSLVLFLNARKARSAAIGSSDEGDLEGALGGV